MIEMTEQSSHINRQETAKQLEIFIVNGIARPGEFCKGEFCKGNEDENIAIKVQMPCEDRKWNLSPDIHFLLKLLHWARK